MTSVSTFLDTPGSFGIDGYAMNAQSNFMADDLERRIAFQAGLLATALTRDEQLAAQEELYRLHAMRSPERVEQMERERGLR